MFEFLQVIAEFFQVGIFDFFDEAMKHVTTWLIIAWIKVKINGLLFAWEVAQGVLQGLNVFSTIHTAWGAIPGRGMAGLSFFRVHEALNLLLTAGMTRFVLSILPF